MNSFGVALLISNCHTLCNKYMETLSLQLSQFHTSKTLNQGLVEKQELQEKSEKVASFRKSHEIKIKKLFF